MRAHPLAACIAIVALTMFAAGVLFERWVGTDAMIDWVGWRHKLALHRTRSTADRHAVTLPTTGQERTMVALVFGQSNAGQISASEPCSPNVGMIRNYAGADTSR